MRRVLHIVTREDEPLAAEIIRLQSEQPDREVDVVELGQGRPDYEALLEKIFAADCLHVW
jgi:hypothetical protein